ncbi:MAG: ATP-dependent helicase [Nocardioidaceae bacterium]|nr:ATP-dependent helicase [Nocardioidaceae bacterium]
MSADAIATDPIATDGFDTLRGVGDLVDLLGVPFSDEQLAAITAPLAPGVIVAGAGSGKTTVMAARVVWLVGTGQMRPAEVLGLTFTTKATAELAAGVRSRLQLLAARAGRPGLLEQHGEPTVATYHAYAGSLLAQHGLHLGFEPDLRLVSDASRYQLAARAIGSFRGVREHLSISMPTLIGQVLALDSGLSDHLVDVDEVRSFDHDLCLELAEEKQIQDVLAAVTAAHGRDELLELVEAYRQVKADAGVLEFADQMARGAQLGEQCPPVGAMERERFAVVLLDEYQDTSVSQRRMLQGLFSGETAAAGRGHPVTAVGDPCQAIYGWRGASVNNIDSFPTHFRGMDGRPARRFALSVNRRCSQRVLAAANDLAQPLYGVHDGAEPLVTPADAAEGRLQVRLHQTVVDEVAAVVDDVARLGAHYAVDGGARTWSDIAVLVRDGNERGALATGLRARGVPVEVVGLAGLLHQPEVADVLATLRCLSSLTANADLLRMLAGPRWRIGPRDLALLGARSRQLARAGAEAGGDGGGEAGGDGELRARLDVAVAGVDDTEVVSLSDALDDPGARGYSAAARARFEALSAELTGLRRAAGDPLVDLVRRVIDVLGIDVELAVESGPAAELARDNLALFADAVADFAGNDQGAGLYGLLAYLDAELEHGSGMDVADPGQDDSVKLLTVHAAKGLEWRAVVLPFWSTGVFPSGVGRSRWERTASAVPVPLRGDADGLPRQASWAAADRKAYEQAHRAHGALEERRLAYVAVTRAKEMVRVSGHWWGRTQKNPRGPSPYLLTLRPYAEVADVDWAPGPAEDAPNPVVEQQPSVPFPGRLDEPVLERRRLVAAEVERALAGGGDGDAGPEDPGNPDLAVLDAEIDTLLAEAARDTGDTIVVDLPAQLSASTAMRVATEPDVLARELARPMPRRPSAAARFGTRFHAWVEARFGQQQLIDPDDLPGRADADITDDADFDALVAEFGRGPYAERVPYAVEAPFQLALGGRLVRGRIDAVYARDGGGFDIVDWKTNRRADADPTQLAIYRLAWAELNDLTLDEVAAAFYYVRTGAIVAPTDLPDRAALEAQLFDADSGSTAD